MNTFLPYDNFKACASVLDNVRLWKQCVEVLQICNAIRGLSKGWINHPCIRMWQPHLPALVEYGMVICCEWQDRGGNDPIMPQLAPLRVKYKAPPWLGSPKLHSSHKANLLRKDPVHYGSFGWTESPQHGYFWPTPWYAWKAHEVQK